MAGDHKCLVCQATFTRPQHVARHMRSHTGDRPYKCTHCGDQFARSDLLSRHVNKCHASEKPPITSAPTNRRKGQALASTRATTSKQACDQCVISTLPCDGSNPCSKCVNRKIACTYVKFQRQTAPSGPGHRHSGSLDSSTSSHHLGLGVGRSTAGTTTHGLPIAVPSFSVPSMQPQSSFANLAASIPRTEDLFVPSTALQQQAQNLGLALDYGYHSGSNAPPPNHHQPHSQQLGFGAGGQWDGSPDPGLVPPPSGTSLYAQQQPQPQDWWPSGHPPVSAPPAQVAQPGAEFAQSSPTSFDAFGSAQQQQQANLRHHPYDHFNPHTATHQLQGQTFHHPQTKPQGQTFSPFSYNEPTNVSSSSYTRRGSVSAISDADSFDGDSFSSGFNPAFPSHSIGIGASGGSMHGRAGSGRSASVSSRDHSASSSSVHLPLAGPGSSSHSIDTGSNSGFGAGAGGTYDIDNQGRPVTRDGKLVLPFGSLSLEDALAGLQQQQQHAHTHPQGRDDGDNRPPGHDIADREMKTDAATHPHTGENPHEFFSGEAMKMTPSAVNATPRPGGFYFQDSQAERENMKSRFGTAQSQTQHDMYAMGDGGDDDSDGRASSAALSVDLSHSQSPYSQHSHSQFASAASDHSHQSNNPWNPDFTDTGLGGAGTGSSTNYYPSGYGSEGGVRRGGRWGLPNPSLHLSFGGAGGQAFGGGFGYTNQNPNSNSNSNNHGQNSTNQSNQNANSNSNSGTTPIERDFAHNNHSSMGQVASGSDETTPAARDREAEMKELREFWKQYLRTPFSEQGGGGGQLGDHLAASTEGEGSGGLASGSSANSGGSGGRPEMGKRGLSRVASLPSVRTPPEELGLASGLGWGALGQLGQFGINQAYGGAGGYSGYGGLAGSSKGSARQFYPLPQRGGASHSQQQGQQDSDSTSQNQSQNQNSGQKNAPSDHTQAQTEQQQNQKQGGVPPHAPVPEEDLSSYEQAVLARQAPMKLSIAPRIKGRVRGASVATGGSGPSTSSLLLGGGSGTKSASPSLPSSSGQQGQQAQTQQQLEYAQQQQQQHYLLAANAADSAGLVPGSMAGLSPEFASGSDDGSGSASVVSASVSASASASANNSNSGSASNSAANSVQGSGRPSFKRLPSQTLESAHTKRHLFEWGEGGEYYDESEEGVGGGPGGVEGSQAGTSGGVGGAIGMNVGAVASGSGTGGVSNGESVSVYPSQLTTGNGNGGNGGGLEKRNTRPISQEMVERYRRQGLLPSATGVVGAGAEEPMMPRGAQVEG